MNIKFRRILLISAFLVFIFVISTCAKEEGGLKYQGEPGSEQIGLQDSGTENGLAKKAESSQSREEEGKNLYLAALKILRPLRPTLLQMSPSHIDDVVIVAARLITNSVLSFLRIASPSQPEAIKGQRILSDNLRTAVEMLERSGVELENDDALFLLGEMNFYGKYTHPRNYSAAHHYYTMLANRSGNATAQQTLGFLHATGLGGISRDQGKALLFHTFAGHAHDTAAEMTLGYRYMMGIGTPQKCEEAAWWYKRVADKAIAHYRSGPPGGRAIPVGVKIRLYEDQGGVYGFGASQESVYERAHRGGNPDSAHATIEEVYEFYKYNSIIDGEYETQLILASLLHTGSRTIPRNYKRALELLESIAKRYFPPLGSPPGTKGPSPINNPKSIPIAGRTAGLLGLMHWRGEGVPASNKIAYLWFSQGAELGNPTSLNALGVMYSTGVDGIVEQDRERAIEYWKKAADKEDADAYVNLGYEYLQSHDTQTVAVQYFSLAAAKKHLLAYYYLAEMYFYGTGISPSCEIAVNWYKMVAERGDWLHSPFEAAWSGYKNGDLGAAALQYLLAAERGYELAQANVAWLLDPARSALRIPRWLASSPPPPALLDRAAELALIYWTRSANQGNVDARVKMGDYYFSGIGVPRDPEKAAACYQVAAELANSPIAMWNLGYMYENGIGTTQDFYLAKRWYDNSLSTNSDGALPVTLSLAKLHIRYLWHRLSGGAAATSESEWGFLGGKGTNGGKSTEDDRINQDGQMVDDSGLDGSEVARPTPDDDTVAEDEQLDDLVRSWNRRRKAEEMGTDDDRTGNDVENEEDEFGGRLRRRRDNEELDDDMIDDDVFETFLILVVIVVVGWLVYVRQFRFAGAPAPGVQQRAGADGGGAGGMGG